jgi:hypothetical protein
MDVYACYLSVLINWWSPRILFIFQWKRPCIEYIAAPVSEEERERVAYEDCGDQSLASLVNMQAMSNTSRNHTQTMNPLSIFFFIADVNTCLSAALSNQDTCLEGFQQEEMWIVISPTKYNKHQRSYPNWSEIPWQCSRPCSSTPAWKILVYTVNRGIILQCLNLLHKP